MSPQFFQPGHRGQRPHSLAGVGGLELRSSEMFGRDESSFNLRCCAARFLIETTGLPLQTERQCRRLMWPLLPHVGSPPRWRYRIVGLRWWWRRVCRRNRRDLKDVASQHTQEDKARASQAREETCKEWKCCHWFNPQRDQTGDASRAAQTAQGNNDRRDH